MAVRACSGFDTKSRNSAESGRSGPDSVKEPYLAPITVIPWARTGTEPSMGSTVGANGSDNVPSEFTLRVWKALAAGVLVELDNSFET